MSGLVSAGRCILCSSRAESSSRQVKPYLESSGSCIFNAHTLSKPGSQSQAVSRPHLWWGRQWSANGIMSSDEANSDKHKMERFLHDGRHGMLSVVGPLAFGNLPLLAFHRDEDGALQLAATGTCSVVRMHGCMRVLMSDSLVYGMLILIWILVALWLCSWPAT